MSEPPPLPRSAAEPPRSSRREEPRILRRRRRLPRRPLSAPPRAPGSVPEPAPAAPLPASGAPAPWRRLRARWFAASLVLHALALLGALVVYGARSRPPARDEPIPISLLDRPPLAAAEPAEAADAPVVAFGRVRPELVREAVEMPRESLALVPPPLEVPASARAAAGGLAVDASGPPSLLGELTLSGEGGGMAGRGTGGGNALGAEGSFQSYVAGLREGGLDVVFVIDATGSMSDVLQEVRSRLPELARTLRRLVPLTRFGIVAYRDRDDPEFTTRVAPLTLSARRLQGFLDRLDAEGGGDLPEAVDAGLRAAVELRTWKEGARHVIIVLGDAPPPPDRLPDAIALAEDFHRAGGVVTTVDVGIEANPELWEARTGRPAESVTTIHFRGPLPAFLQIARAGGGEGSTLAGERRLLRQVAVLVFGTQWAEEMRPLLADL